MTAIRKVFFVAVLLCSVVFFGFGARAADCNPANTICYNPITPKTCPSASLGVSTMDKDQKHIIVCLRDDNDATKTVWKAMAGGEDSSCAAITAQNCWDINSKPVSLPAGINKKTIFVLCNQACGNTVYLYQCIDGTWGKIGMVEAAAACPQPEGGNGS